MYEKEPICDAIGCMRMATYVRDDREGLEPEYLCAVCYRIRVTNLPTGAPWYDIPLPVKINVQVDTSATLSAR